MRDDLFFIALLPPPDIQAEVTVFKEYAARHFRSSRALRSPPHLTIAPPFFWPSPRRSELIQVLSGFSDQEVPFRLGLKSFNCFRPRVIYVDVEPSDELKSLYRRLHDCLSQELGIGHQEQRDYHPHLTVAFKDLRRANFESAWAHFSGISFERRFEVTALSLLAHKDRRWEIQGTFPFGGATG